MSVTDPARDNAAERPSTAELRQRLIEERLRNPRRTMAPATVIPAAPRDEPLPLSPSQERLWLLGQIRPESTEYLIPVGYRLSGPLDVDALRAALDGVIARHEVLRTRFVEIDGRPCQVIDAPRPLTLDIRDIGDSGSTADLDELLEMEDRPFDLAREWPVRATLARVASDKHVLLLSFHHIAFDGRSAEILERELTRLYSSKVEGLPATLSPVGRQYADYAVWRRQRPVPAEHVEYWRGELAGVEVWEAPLDRPRPAQWDPDGALVRFEIPRGTAETLLEAGKQRGATPFMTLFAAYSTFLSRHWGMTDLTVGTPVAGRSVPEISETIGYFVNTVVLRSSLSDGTSFQQAIDQARDTTLRAFAHADLPFGQLVDELGPERNPAANPLYQTMLTVTDGADDAGHMGGLHLSPLAVEWAPARFDLALNLAQQADGSVSGGFVYAAALFDRATIERLAASFVRFCEHAVAAPSAPLGHLDSIAPAERDRVLFDWNDTAVARIGLSLVDLVESQVSASPEAVAVAMDDVGLSYSELDRRANRLAHHLRDLGVGTESRVAVCMHRAPEMVVALLAVIKAGGAYVPVDPEYPYERIAYMLGDADAEVVLTQSAHLDLFGDAVQVVCVDDLDLSGRPAAAPSRRIGSDNAAYVIYTSGSTGRPKGAVNTHGGIVNRLLWMQSAYQLSARDVVLQKTPFAFDVSVWEFFWPLITGATLVVAQPGGHRDGAYLRDTIIRHGVTVCHFVPSMLRIFLEIPEVQKCVTLRDVICSGEALPADVARTFMSRCDARLHNLYGPTEAAVDVTSWRCHPEDTAVPIGAPIDNIRVYVLDAAMRPVPIGVPGELFIAGTGLARGYLNRPAMTADRFVPDPFGRPGARLYRTGDKVRWLDHGAIEFLGRFDHQVKLAGHRIELGEIEAVLAEHPQIRAAVVSVHDGRLLGHVVPDAEIAVSELRAWLGRRLPSYLVPGLFVFLDQMPLSPHGKIDRAALPAPSADRDIPAHGRTSPRSEQEIAIAQAWSEVLGVTHVGVDDNFFELGGDSIRALQTVGSLAQNGWQVAVRDVFEYQTAEALAKVMRRTTAEPTAEEMRVEPFALIDPADRAALPADVTDAYPLSMVQAGMIYEMLGAEALHPYHNVTGYVVNDDAPLDLSCLRTAAQLLLARHEVLRTVIDLTSYTESLQLVRADAQVEIGFEDLRALPLADQDLRAQTAVDRERRRLFDLSRAPLFRLYTQQLTDTTWRLGWVECHAILDGWSHNSLVTELLEIYRAVRSGGSIAADPADVGRFADFIALERTALDDADTQAFWERRILDNRPLRTPSAWADPATTDPFPYDLAIPIGHLTPGLRELARAAEAPLKSVLFAAHLTVLRMISDESAFHTGLAVNGRPEVFGGDRVRGMFLNIVPFATPSAGRTWRDLVADVFAAEVGLWPHRRYPAPAMQRQWADGKRFIEVLFSFLDFHVLDRDALDVPATTDYSPTEFALVVSTAPDLLMLSIAPDRIARPHGERLARIYTAVLTAMAGDLDGDPDACLLPAAELEMLTEEWANPVAAAPDGLVHEVFAAQAAATPGAVALRCGDEQLTYGELNLRANRLSHHLRSCGAGPETVVGICLERSIELVVAVLATLKADAAYLALNHEDPAHRLRQMLTGAGVGLVVTTTELDDLPTTRDVQTIRVDRLDLDGAPDDDLPARASSDNLAYLIYTSGSTGRAKAVGVTHGAVVQFVTDQRYGALGSDEVHLLHSPMTFDAVTFEIWAPLLNGGCLAIAPHGHLLPEDFRGLLARHEVTSLFMTTMLFMLVVEHDVTIFAGLRQLYFGGEAVHLPHIERTRTALPEVRLTNCYGPTEATVFGTYYPIPAADALPARSVPIGVPIGHSEAYVLDERGHPAPVGVPGELYLGGAGLARGYLGQAALTAERFVPHPFSTLPGARLYRTGDRVCWLADGTIGFLGRVDDQVKISGQRIEPGEIEAAIVAHSRVSQAAVVAHAFDVGDKRLVAYVSTDDGTPIDAAALRTALRSRLPDYMLPAIVISLPELPVNASGKVDRRALPPPDRKQSAPGHFYVPPRTEVEALLADAWAQALGVARVGAHDDFVGLGGHSLMAMRIAASLRREHGLEVNVREILSLRTVAAVAAAIARRTGEGAHYADTGEGESSTSLVWFRPGDRQPVFLIHPGGGSVHWYRDLSAALPDGHPVAALQHPGLSDTDQAGLDIEEVAKLYLADVRSAQASGPYRLFGWCAGAPVTWELARQLDQAGERVSVVLLDPTMVGAEPLEQLVLLRRCERLFDELHAAPPELASPLRDELAATLTRLVETDGGEPIVPADLDESWLTRLRIWRGQSEAMHRHHPQPAHIPLQVVVTNEITDGGFEAMGGRSYQDYTDCWRELAHGDAPVASLDASHLGALAPPQVRTLADVITAWHMTTQAER